MLVIGDEKMSSIVNWEDRTTCVIFADGAGAVVLEAKEGKGTFDDTGVLSTHLHADGEQCGILYTDGGPSSTKSTGHIVMHVKEVFKFAVKHMAHIVDEVLTANAITSDKIDWLVPHQANVRIIAATAEKRT